MAKKDKLLKQNVITILLGFLAIIVAIMMVIMQEIYRLIQPPLIHLIIEGVLAFVTFLALIYYLSKVMETK